MYDTKTELRKLTSEQLRNLYNFLNHVEEYGFLYMGRDERRRLFLTKVRVTYNIERGCWATASGDVIFSWKSISPLIEKAMFGYVPVEFEDGEQMFSGEIMRIIKDINEERGYEILAMDDTLAKVSEIEDDILSLCAKL